MLNQYLHEVCLTTSNTFVT